MTSSFFSFKLVFWFNRDKYYIRSKLKAKPYNPKSMKEDPKLNSAIRYTIEIVIRLGFLLLLIAWCLQIIFPFASIVLWGIILALAIAPLYNTLNNKLNDRSSLSAGIIVISGILMIIIPSWLFLDSMVAGVQLINRGLTDGTLKIPPPTDQVADWPLIGEKIYNVWDLASNSLESLLSKYKDQVAGVASTLFEGAVSIGGSIVQFIFSIIIAGVLLATKGTDQAARQFFKKLIGSKGDEFADAAEITVRNVTKGVIGVAIIQSVLVGVGFLLAGVPYAGLWALLVLILAILQLPPLLVIIPVVFYLFSSTTILPASLWTIYLLLAGASDNLLKPILLGKGAPVPMLVIFIGVIGGFMLSGFIGLFTGAIAISLGYKLFLSWLNDGDSLEEHK